MPEYNVNWSISLEADSAEDAARRALEVQRDPSSLATAFTVTQAESDEDETVVDVAELETEMDSLLEALAYAQARLGLAARYRRAQDVALWQLQVVQLENAVQAAGEAQDDPYPNREFPSAENN